jgi:hypothetical protein
VPTLLVTAGPILVAANIFGLLWLVRGIASQSTGCCESEEVEAVACTLENEFMGAGYLR